ncbi:MAG: hypothetical protein U0871_16710 [Gemmataceae bacterium]
MRFFSSRRGSGEPSLDRAVGRHLKSEHLTQLFELLKLREQNIHKEVTDRLHSQPKLILWSVIAVLVFTFLFGWIALYFGKSEIILPVVTGIGGLVSGGLAGFGYGSLQANKDKKRSQESPLP